MNAIASASILFGKHLICSNAVVLFHNQATCDAFNEIMEDYEYTNWIIHAEELISAFGDGYENFQINWCAIANVINETNENLNNIIKW